MSYADLADLKAELAVTGTAHDSVLTDALDWATDLIDAYTGRSFTATTGTRYYDSDARDPDDPKLLVVDADLLSVGTLLNGDDDSTEIAGTAYTLWPRNDTPKWGIKLKTDTDWAWDTDYTVAVVGTWGYMTSPDDLVKGCTLRLAAWRYKAKDVTPTTTIFSESVQTTKPPSFVTDALELLAPYRRLV